MNMDVITIMPYALITPYSYERMMFDLERTPELKIISRALMQMEIEGPELKVIFSLKLVSNQHNRPWYELDTLRSFDARHCVGLISELIRRARSEGESYAKQLKNYADCFNH